MSVSTTLSAELQRQLAVETYNRTWELIDKAGRTAAEDREMLRCAFASRHHWEQVGGDEERAIGDWQIAHVASLLGDAALALRFAQSALDTTVSNDWNGWRLATCYEGMARAHAVVGNRQERDRYVELAKDALRSVEDAEDRKVIEGQLRTVPTV